MPKRKTKMDKHFDRIMELYLPVFDKLADENIDPITMLYAATLFIMRGLCDDEDEDGVHDRINDAFWRMYDELCPAQPK